MCGNIINAMQRLAMLAALALSSVTVSAQEVLNVIGDSYVANHRRPKEEAWHYKMASQLGLKYNNYGRNGSCVATTSSCLWPANGLRNICSMMRPAKGV